MMQQGKIERAASEPPPGSLAVPASPARATPPARTPPGDPSRGAAEAQPMIDLSLGRSGSIALVLIVAVALVAAATGIVLVGGSNTEPYILGFLAVLATVGVFSLFALAAGIMRLTAPASENPIAKALVEGASDAIVVTDAEGRVVYANPAYLDLTGATGPGDLRPVERAFIGDADASEAIYRLLKAAREGKRLEEEVRIAGMKGRPALWLRLKIRPLGE